MTAHPLKISCLDPGLRCLGFPLLVALPDGQVLGSHFLYAKQRSRGGRLPQLRSLIAPLRKFFEFPSLLLSLLRQLGELALRRFATGRLHVSRQPTSSLAVQLRSVSLHIGSGSGRPLQAGASLRQSHVTTQSTPAAMGTFAPARLLSRPLAGLHPKR